MALWSRRRSQHREESLGDLTETLVRANQDFTEALVEATARSTSAIRAGLANTGQVGPSSMPITRKSTPTGDVAGDGYLKSSYLTMDTANRARKITLYQAWLSETVVSSCVDAIASHLVSGGWILKPKNEKHPDQTTKGGLQELLDWCNPLEEFAQVIHSMATDLLWCGETYLEITTRRSAALHRTVPYELYTVDPISMDYVLNDSRKDIRGYIQTSDTGHPIRFTPDEILRVWLPDPRNKFKGLPPLEKMLNAVTLDTYLQLSEQKFFQQGNRGNIGITLPNTDEAGAGRFLKWLREHALGVKNAHMPLIVYGEEGDIKIQELGNRAELQVIERRKLAFQEISGGYRVPPHILSILEGTGQGGQAVGDTMYKQFQHGAVDPLKRRLMSQLSFRLGVLGFGVNDWTIDTKYADMRDSQYVTTNAKERIFAGISTINKERSSEDEEAVPGGDTPILLAGSQLIPVAHLDQMAEAPAVLPGAALQQGHLPEPPVPGAPTPTAPSEALMEATHAVCCVLAPLPPSGVAYIRQAQAGIDPADLAADGLEDAPHITVRYGLTADDDTTRTLLRHLLTPEPPIPLELGPLGRFSTPEYDVLYAQVTAPALPRLHDLISALVPCQPDTHAHYTPHATIAYLKPGRAAKYLAAQDFWHRQVCTATHLAFTDREERATALPCGGLPTARVAA